LLNVAVALLSPGEYYKAVKTRLISPVVSILLILGFNASAQTPPTAASAQQAKTFEKRIATKAKLNYLLSLPADYEKSRKSWPLVLFLHGAGESGSDLNKVKAHGPPKLVETRGPFPFILVSPQSPGRGWNPDVLNALLDSVIREYRVDKNRVYLTGLSMGGYGSWRLAADHPERFAAVIPICGAGKPEDAAKLKSIPIWAFHGAEDKAVPFQRSVEMVEAIKAAGGTTIRFTTLEYVGHNSWEAAYATPEIYTWLEKQSASNNRAVTKSN